MWGLRRAHASGIRRERAGNAGNSSPDCLDGDPAQSNTAPLGRKDAGMKTPRRGRRLKRSLSRNRDHQAPVRLLPHKRYRTRDHAASGPGVCPGPGPL